MFFFSLLTLMYNHRFAKMCIIGGVSKVSGWANEPLVMISYKYNIPYR